MEERCKPGTRTTSFKRAFCSCILQAEGRGLEAQRVTAARAELSQDGDHLKSFLAVLARCSSNLSALEQSLLSVQQQQPCMSWGFSVDAPRISSEAQLLADLLLWKMVRAAQVKAETTRMAPECPQGWLCPANPTVTCSMLDSE